MVDADIKDEEMADADCDLAGNRKSHDDIPVHSTCHTTKQADKAAREKL